MRWPWERRHAPELKRQIEALQRKSSDHLDSVQEMAADSRNLAASTADTRDWAKTIRERNHFAEAYLPSTDKRFRLPWKR